ncbi:heat shock 70 kDa protein 12A-like [Ruditapes philippinarum]|uniref:heat shock 70 kDa protein 12A-like n=1 Tax=Ruditapes philippinarum TaxID=129788 RepID=UPI00295A69F0|nr:heat shock 70 kDa protein 12A-like [Ruditapes philippinarum]
MGSKSSIFVAIDFGTSYSGFSYMFSTDPDTIITASHGSILPDDRVPTILLLNPDNSLNSFGIIAEDNYAKLMMSGKHTGYRLFREFKMALYANNERLDSDINIYDTENRPMNAMTVFSMVINLFKELVLKSIKQSKLSQTYSFENDIIWMITIPAIWSDSARQFMRRAATLAGIDEKCLRLVLEPEAAALYCKDQQLHISTSPRGSCLKPKSKYILADLGGGTVDFCVHEVLPKGEIRELYRVVGGVFGGSNVNNEFIQFLIKLFGAPVMKKFKKTQYYDYLMLTRGFEHVKNTFDSGHTNTFVIGIPITLIQMAEEDSDSSVETLVKQSVYASCVEFRDGNKFCCKEELMETFYKSSLHGIITTLNEIKSCCTENVDTLLIVGGFSESQYLREFIKRKVQIKDLVLAKEPRLAVLKGALKMGLKPNTIISRRARYTYGFRVAVPFNRNLHPQSLKFRREGKYFCDRIFSKVIERDMDLKVGQSFKVNVNEEIPTNKNMNLSIALYRSPKKNPTFCLESDEECTEVGTINIKAPREGWPSRYNIDQFLIADETELKVKAIDKTNGRELQTNVTFL